LTTIPIPLCTRTPQPAPGWAARLELALARRGERTALVRNRSLGPLRVLRPFYPTPAECHLYVLHPPGGLVAGDSLDIAIECGADTRVLCTTPGAGRAYRGASAAQPQTQTVQIRVAAGAHCEWLPQENILFAGAWARSEVQVTLAPGAHYTGWDIACLGRPASAERFARGAFEQQLWLWRGARPLLGERQRFAGGDAILDAPWGLGGCPVFGIMVTTTGDAATRDRLRERIAAHSDADLLAAATLLPGVLAVRAHARCSARLRALFIALWQELRRGHDGAEPALPRIWAT
jgi:Urease accessory protein UreH